MAILSTYDIASTLDNVYLPAFFGSAPPVAGKRNKKAPISLFDDRYLKIPTVDGRKLLTVSGKETDVASIQINRNALYTGGSPGFVNSALRIQTLVGPGVTAFEWAGLFIVDNNAAAGENVALYAQAHKRTTGPTWAQVSELRDYNTDPVGSAVAHEFDVFANGTDANNNRIGIHVVIGKRDTAGVQNETAYGVRVTPQNSDPTTGKVKRGVSVETQFDVAAFDASRGSQGATGAAFAMADGMAFKFDTAGVRRWLYAGGSLAWQINGITRFAVAMTNDAHDGEVTIQGSQILGPRKTGWGLPTGTLSRAAFDQSTVTLQELAQRVAALVSDLYGGTGPHGLIGA